MLNQKAGEADLMKHPLAFHRYAVHWTFHALNRKNVQGEIVPNTERFCFPSDLSKRTFTLLYFLDAIGAI